MKKILTLLTIVVCCFSAIAQIDRTQAPEGGPVPEIKFGKSESFTMDNGLTVIVVENHKLPQVHVDVYFDYPPVYMEDKVGLLSIFGDMMRAGTKKYSKEEIDEESEYLGTMLFASSRMAGFAALERNLEPSLKILSDIVLNPTFDNDKEFNKLVKQMLTSLELSNKDPDEIMSRVHKALLYGKSHPYGEFTTEATLKNIRKEDFKAFYDDYIKPNVSYLTFVGDITVDKAKKLAGIYFSNWKTGDVSKANLPKIPVKTETEIILVDLPTSTQANIYISHLMDLKKTDDDFYALKLGNELLGGSSFSRLYKNIREDKGYTYGAYSNVHSDRYIGKFAANAKVRNAVVDSAIVEFIKEIKKITTELPKDKELQTFKTLFTGTFALQMENPKNIAGYTRNELMEKLGKGFYVNYLKNINAVSANEILEATAKHVVVDRMTIFVVGKSEEILPRLKKLNYPIRFYDEWATLTTDPTIVEKAGLGAMEVVDKYIEAIGGKKELNSKKTMIVNSEMFMSDAPQSLLIIEKKTANNQQSFSIYFSTPGNHSIPSEPKILVMKRVFDGKSGYMQQGNIKKPLIEDEIKSYKLAKGIFPQLYYKDITDYIQIEGIVSYKGHDVYKLKITPFGQEQYEYYNTETFLLEKSEQVSKINEQTILTIEEISDYKEVDGIKVPHTIKGQEGPHSYELKMKNIEFDEKIPAEEFIFPADEVNKEAPNEKKP